MEYLVIYLLVLVVLLVIYFINNKKKKLGLSKSLQYITKRFELNMDKKRIKILSIIVMFTNSIIIYVPMMLVIYNIEYYKLIGFCLIWFMISIVSLYNLVGYILKKKGW